MAITSMERIP